MTETTDPLDEILRDAQTRGEALLYTPPTHVRDGHHAAYPPAFELIPNPIHDADVYEGWWGAET